jgi:hypothetical protein
MCQNRPHIDSMPRRDSADRGGRQGHRFRHRQIKPHKPLQAFRPPAMRRGLDARRGRHLGEIGKHVHLLHCGDLSFAHAGYAKQAVTQA